MMFYTMMVVSLLSMIVTTLLLWRSLAKVPGHEALVIATTPSPRVRFTTSLVLPIVQRADRIDLRVVPLQISRRDRDSLHCKDNIRVEVDVVALVRVHPTAEDILRVHAAFGATPTHPKHLHDLFDARVVESLRSALRDVDHDAVVANHGEVAARMLEKLGRDHHGFRVEAVALVRVTPAAKSVYDSTNILDADGLLRLLKRESSR